MKINFVRLILVIAMTMACCRVFGADSAAPKRTFHVTFDKWDTVADEAGGNPKSDFNASLMLRQPEGAFSRAGIRIETGERLSYDLPGNIDTRRGTISFWFKPYMWNDQHWKRRITLLRVDMGDIKGWMLIGCMENTFFQFNIWGQDVMGGDPTAGQQAGARIPDWSLDPVWHKVDVTWDSIDTKEMALYIDGKFENKTTLSAPIPLSKAGRISLIPLNDWLGSPFNNTNEKTLIDEVEIWDHPRPEPDLIADYNRTKGLVPKDYTKPVLSVPLASGKVSVDGRLDEPAWQNASTIPLRLSIGPTGLATQDPGGSMSACYDAHALYLAWTGREASYHATFSVDGSDHIIDVSIGNSLPGGILQESRIDKGIQVTEVAIPWNAIGLGSPKLGDKLSAGFFMVDNGKGASWNLMPDTQISAKHMGTLILGDIGAQVKDASAWDSAKMSLSVRLPKLDKPIKAFFDIKSGGKSIVSETREIKGASGSFTLDQYLPEIPFGIASLRLQKDGEETPFFAYDLPIASKPPVSVEYIPLVKKNRFLFQISFKGLSSKWQEAISAGKANLKASLFVPGVKHASSVNVRLKSVTQEIQLPVDKTWPAGVYTLVLGLTDTVTHQTIDFRKQIEKPSTPWLGSSIGLDDTVVPSPWTPVRITGKTASCWGRDYQFDGPFLSSVVGQGKEMLAAPIRMTLVCDSGKHELGQGPVKWTAAEPARATYTGSSSDNGLKFDYDGSMEFDGFVLTHVKISPPDKGMRVDSLVLEIPLKSEFVKWMRNPKMFVERGNPLHLEKQWDGASPFSTPFKSYIWVGNLDQGFDWMCESDANWNYEEGAQPCKIVPSGDVTYLRFEIISKPGTVTKPLEYTFGFQATPVKPHKPGWRHFRSTAGPIGPALGNEPCANITTFGYDYTFEYISWPVPQEWPRDQVQEVAPGFGNLDVKLKMFRTNGVKGMAYTSGIVIPDNNPVWDFFAGAWQNKLGPISRGNTGGGYKTRRDGKTFSMAGADPASWSPFLAYMVDGLLSNPSYRDDMAGIYVDNTSPYLQNNPYNGSGYSDDAFGRSGYSMSILGLRDLAMRLLRVIRKDKGADGVLWLHAHNDLILPIHGLGDYFFPGEQYGYLVVDKPYLYMDYLPLDVFRAEMNPDAYGVPQIMLHMLGSVYAHSLTNDRGPTESVIAICALHDCIFNLMVLNPDSLKEYFSIVDATGMADAEFMPYWKENGFATNDPKAKVSAYRAGDRVMAVGKRPGFR